MIKKIISITLALIFIFTALPSCADEPAEDTAPETTLPDPETTEETVLYSFYAKATSYIQGYIVLRPEEGSEEAEKWNEIYLTDLIDGTRCPRIHYGKETVEVVYSGEIEAMTDENGNTKGHIKDVYSIQIKDDARQYNDIYYGVAVLNGGPSFEVIEKFGGMAESGDYQYGIMRIEGTLFASDRDELIYLAENCIIGKVYSTATRISEQEQENIDRLNQRYRLLDGYDEDFFEQYDLLLISIYASSGYMRFDVTDIAVDAGICTLTIEITEPPLTDDIGRWTFLVSIPKEVSRTITEYKTYTPKPEWYN